MNSSRSMMLKYGSELLLKDVTNQFLGVGTWLGNQRHPEIMKTMSLLSVSLTCLNYAGLLICLGWTLCLDSNGEGLVSKTGKSFVTLLNLSLTAEHP